MSRYRRAAPDGHTVELAGGYHLCARCGYVQCTDDRAVVVHRAPWWLIYTHLEGPDCRTKAVSGWRAVERAIDMRESNAPTPRGADCVSIGGLILPFVSLLDDEHCKVEMDAVTISQREFLPTASGAESEDENFNPDLIERWGDCRHWREWRHKEAKIVEALDLGMCGALVTVARHVLRHERAPLYVNATAASCAVTLSERDARGIRAMPSLSVRSLLLTAKSKATAPQGRSRRPDGGLSNGFSTDAIGRPVEYPLYSQQPLTDGSRVIKFGGQGLDELTYYRLSGPKPKVSNLPFNSASSPEMFDWRNDVPTALVEHWKNNPKSAPYGPVARLKPAVLASLRTPTQTQAQV